jgi:inhibitor of cysteine peptidase
VRYLRIGIVLMLVAGLALVVSGCAGKTAETKTLVVTEQEASSTVTLAKGQELAVKLDGNPSTGFTWAAETIPPFLAEQGEPTFEQAPTTGSAVGAGGTQTILFAATTSGKGELKLTYARPWEKGVEPAKTFAITVDAK